MIVVVAAVPCFRGDYGRFRTIFTPGASAFMTEAYAIRPMRPSDFEKVVEIENLCYSNPWSAELFQRELDNPVASVDLLWIEESLAGYLCSWLVGGELSILNVAVAPDFRRRGAAATLLRHRFEKSRRQGFERAFLEVRAGNAGAIVLYRSFGFREISVRKGYYPDGEDAVIMVRDEGATDNGQRTTNQETQ